MSFSDRLREARKKAGLTQMQIAEKLGITAQSYSQYETGKRRPKSDTISKIADALNVGYSYTKDGEPYFYSFVDTVPDPEYSDNEKFNRAQYEDAESIQRIITPYNNLNSIGQNKAIEQVELLTKIPEYRKDTE